LEVEYLTAENRVLPEKLGGLKLRLTDAESPSALEEAIESPHLAGTQALEADAHAGKLLCSAGLNPADLAAHLDRLRLRGNVEADLYPSLQRKRRCGFHEHASQRDVASGGDLSVFADKDLHL
jgi:hypothetical protein